MSILSCGVSREHSGRAKMMTRGVSVSSLRMIEKIRFDVYFACGVGRRHSGRATMMAHKVCLYFVC